MKAGDLRSFLRVYKISDKQDKYGACDQQEPIIKSEWSFKENRRIRYIDGYEHFDLKAKLDYSLESDTSDIKRICRNSIEATVRIYYMDKISGDDLVEDLRTKRMYRVTSVIPDGQWAILQLEAYET
jgi:hypothetical protein